MSVKFEVFEEREKSEADKVFLQLSQDESGVSLFAVDKIAVRIPAGNILKIYNDGTLKRFEFVSSKIGLKLNKKEQIIDRDNAEDSEEQQKRSDDTKESPSEAPKPGIKVDPAESGGDETIHFLRFALRFPGLPGDLKLSQATIDKIADEVKVIFHEKLLAEIKAVTDQGKHEEIKKKESKYNCHCIHCSFSRDFEEIYGLLFGK